MSLFERADDEPLEPGLRTKPMGWVLQGGCVESCSQWIHHGCPDCLTRLGTVKTQTYRRGTARDSRIAESSGGSQRRIAGLNDGCPAGRAHCAWGGHFVACIPVLVGWDAPALPLVGIVIFLTNCGHMPQLPSVPTGLRWVAGRNWSGGGGGGQVCGGVAEASSEMLGPGGRG
jgi:hypothetical protein